MDASSDCWGAIWGALKFHLSLKKKHCKKMSYAWKKWNEMRNKWVAGSGFSDSTYMTCVLNHHNRYNETDKPSTPHKHCDRFNETDRHFFTHAVYASSDWCGPIWVELTFQCPENLCNTMNHAWKTRKGEKRVNCRAKIFWLDIYGNKVKAFTQK